MTLRDDLVRTIEDENEKLRERILELEDMLGMTFDAPLTFGLTAKEAKVLGLLSKVPMATKEAIMSTLYFDRPNDMPEIKIVDVFVCKLRRKLEAFEIEVETVWGRGYSLSAQGKAKLAEYGANS